MKNLGIAETTLRLLSGRIEFDYDALRGGKQWHISCNGCWLCNNACWPVDVTKTYVAGQTELPTPMCYTCFLVFNSPTVVVLP